MVKAGGEMSDWFVPSRFEPVGADVVTYCAVCEKDTVVEKWGRNVEDDTVEEFCNKCMTIKRVTPYQDVSQGLKNAMTLLKTWRL
tara:strand:+ start:84 stop:338 length:255 start_codon:yes stop_codon:yes gene_type:complete